MNEQQADLLYRFANGPTVADRWTAARELMAGRQLVSIIETQQFEAGFHAISEEAGIGSGINRLVAIDLIVRLSSLAKRLAPAARDALERALTTELPPLSKLGDSKALPEAAKPAEFRENVALALKSASGEWIVPYVVRALISEDKSQRCRLELARQLAARERSIDSWLFWITGLPLHNVVVSSENPENTSTRLRDLASALSDTISHNRRHLTVSENAGIYLAKLCGLLVPIAPRSNLPQRLATAAAEVSRLLDEFFAVKLILLVQPETYAVLETFERWWRPLPYPKVLSDALVPIVNKLVTGITLRARWGQKSESLADRLRLAIGDIDAAKLRLRQIAEDEAGLSEEIDDWLRDRSRATTQSTAVATSSLRAVETEDLTEAIAPLLLDAEDTLSVLPQSTLEGSMDHAQRLANAIKSLALHRGLSVVGARNDVVEYRSLAHQTVSGHAPSDPWVKIIRPMVVRRRRDGSEDVVVRAIVTEAQRESGD